MRTPVHFRLDSRDYLDWMAIAVSSEAGRQHWFTPTSDLKTASTLEAMILALCDELRARGHRFGYPAEEMNRMFITPCGEAMYDLTSRLSRPGEQDNMAEAWYHAISDNDFPLPYECMSMMEVFCNFWIHSYLPNSKLEPITECTLLSTSRTLLDLSYPTPLQMNQLFRECPGATASPLFLGRFAASRPQEDALPLFIFGFMLPIYYAAKQDFGEAVKAAIARAEKRGPLTPRGMKIVKFVAGLFKSHAPDYWGVWQPQPRPISNSSDFVSSLCTIAKELPIRQWAFSSWRDNVAALFRTVLREFSGRQEFDLEAEQAGEEQAECLALLQRRLDVGDTTSTGALLEARNLLEAREGKALHPLIRTTAELMQVVTANSGYKEDAQPNKGNP